MESITIKDIARLSGCSVTTVSRALNDHRDIKPETKEKIQRVIDEYGYIPNNSARNLKRKDSNTIAIMVKGISNPFFQNMYSLFEQYMGRMKYSLLLMHVEENEDEVLRALEAEKEKKLCGIIFLGGVFDEKRRKGLEKLKVPYILCTADMSGTADKRTYSAVGIDDEKESYRMVKYLCELGHKNIAIIAGKKGDMSIGRLRCEGYRKALFEYGITPDERLICYMDECLPEYTPVNGYAVTKRLLQSGVEFDALYVISDNTAFGACKAILESGRRIPEDYAVASFDGIEMSKYYHPSLTTMKQPCEDMVRAVVKQLTGLIEETTEHRQILFSAELMVGEST